MELHHGYRFSIECNLQSKFWPSFKCARRPVTSGGTETIGKNHILLFGSVVTNSSHSIRASQTPETNIYSVKLTGTAKVPVRGKPLLHERSKNRESLYTTVRYRIQCSAGCGPADVTPEPRLSYVASGEHTRRFSKRDISAHGQSTGNLLRRASRYTPGRPYIYKVRLRIASIPRGGLGTTLRFP